MHSTFVMFPSIKMGSCFVSQIALTAFTFSLAAILFTNCEARNVEGGEALVSCHEHERDALSKFRSKLEYISSHQIASWDQTSRDCCQWRGVVCDRQTGYVLELDLFPHPFYEISRLSGQLDPVLLKLEKLQSLDLSGNLFAGISIPPFLGSLKNLRYLNLSNSGFAGQIPQELGNLSNLEQLDIQEFGLSTSSLHWLRGMPKLKSLNMKDVFLHEVGKDWVQVLNKTFLPSLYELDLSNCELTEIDTSLTSINFNSLQRLNLVENWFDMKFPSWITNISSLEYIDLGYNGFHGVIPHADLAELPKLKYLNLKNNLGNGLNADAAKLFQGAWRSIESLNFAGNNISGQLDLSICNLTSLVSLDLSDSEIHGLPETITDPSSATLHKGWVCLPKLQVLNLNGNNIESGMPNWLGKLTSLQDLDMSNCNLSGRMPTSLGDLSSLRILNLENNRLSGIIPENVWNLCGLETISLGGNSLTAQIEHAQLNQLKRLTYLDLSSNSNIVLHLASNWVPAFQLQGLVLETCSLGPLFPQWLANQTSLRILIISNNFIEDNLPPWFWEIASSLEWLDLSHNKIKGWLPETWNSSLFFFNFDISHNQFSGPLPRTYLTPLPTISFSISGNNFAGTIPHSICDMTVHPDAFDLSQNHLVGKIPQELGNCSGLKYLGLSENHLSGELPWSLSKLKELTFLFLGKNKLSGTIPVSLRNCSGLKILDLGENALSGNLSPLVHNTGLRILLLQSNEFTGALPFNMSSIVNLQILNLFNNQLSGYIPKSIGKLAALTTTMRTDDGSFKLPGSTFKLPGSDRVEVWMSYKGKDLLYDKILYLVSGIDLSRNHFHGEIPKELMKLKGLVFLKLSHNHLTGMIPENIGELRLLESLDLSNNQLEGEIPSSLTQLTFLSTLNLSNNHLQGRIPLGGQLQTLGNQSSYEGNVGLCGLPLQCADEPAPATLDLKLEKREDESELILFPLFLGMGMMFGFVIGLWAFWGFLIVSKLKRIALFKFYDKIMDKLLLLSVICLAKIQAKN